jgi:uncharacterized membrane protein YdjX (TVP38/TMEM64 family)
LFMKIAGIGLCLTTVSVATFLLWGEQLDFLLSQEKCVEWFAEIRHFAWLVAIGLLIADLFLPIPSPGVIAALGSIYGVVGGAGFGAAGSLLSGLVAYGLARLLGKKGIRAIASEEETRRFHDFFDRWGGLGIIVSRMMPILPEVLCVLAGLARMSFWRFLGALLLGTIPAALLFAWIGHAAASQPWYGVGIATGLPLLAWPFFHYFTQRSDRRRTRRTDAPP